MIKVEKIKESPLKDRVKTAILDYIGQLYQARQTKLPSEDDLAKLLGVSRITIRGALEDLNTQGCVFRRHGRGTFINVEALKVKVQFNPVSQFKDIIRESGYTPSAKVIELSQSSASREIAIALNIAEGDAIILARKVFYADKRPACFCIDHFPLAILPSAAALDDYSQYNESIFDFLEAKTGRAIAWDRIEISSVTNDGNAELTRYFECKKQTRAFLLCQGVNFDANDQPMVYAYEYIDTDLIRYNVIRQKAAAFAKQ